MNSSWRMRRSRQLVGTVFWCGVALCVLLPLQAMRSFVHRDWVDLSNGSYLTSESGWMVVCLRGLPVPRRVAWREVQNPREYIDNELDRLKTATDVWHQPGGAEQAKQIGWGDGVRFSAMGLVHGSYVQWATHTVVPYWMPIGAVYLVTAIAWKLRRRLRARERRATGLCEGCGYDLRASGERCPECGRPTTNAAALVHTSGTPGEG